MYMCVLLSHLNTFIVVFLVMRIWYEVEIIALPDQCLRTFEQTHFRVTRTIQIAFLSHNPTLLEEGPTLPRA